MKSVAEFGDRQFAVKEHDSSFLHWDFYLHAGGRRLLSFVLFESPALNPANPIRIKKIEDHEAVYLLLERIIPDGERGAGPKALWDKGVYGLLGHMGLDEQLHYGHLSIFLKACRLYGAFSLQRIESGKDFWIFRKEVDEHINRYLRFPDMLTPEKILELERKSHPKKNSSQMLLM